MKKNEMISISIFWTSLICIGVLALLYISFVQYRRAEKALEAANVLLFNMEQINEYIKEASTTLANPQLRAAFEADDEVGVFFKQIESIQEVLDQILPQSNEKTSDTE